MKFIACNSKAHFIEIAGFDWYKIVKVCGGYMWFESGQEYKTWKAQK